MGIFDKLKGVREPDEGTSAVAPDALVERILGLNGPDAPYEIQRESGGDLVGDWRLADAQWRQVVGQAGFSEAYRLTLRIHADEHDVRALEQTFETGWNLGTGQLEVGSRRERNGRTVKAHTTIHVPGRDAYSFEFDADQLRDPVRDAVTESGWTWRPVLSLNGL